MSTSGGKSYSWLSVQTIPGKGRLMILRLYDALEPWFNETWRLGFQTIKEGAAVDIVFDNAPGRIYHAKITAIPRGVGQGEIAVSGTLARTTAPGGATVFPAVISIPNEISRESLRLGMSGNATAFSEEAGVIGRKFAE